MSYKSSEPFAPKEVFSWGYVDNEVEHSLADKFSPYLRNCRLDGSAITNRPWYTLLSTLTGTWYPLWIWSYLRTSPANDRLVVRFNTDATHDLYTIETDWTLASITTASNITSDNRMNFLNIGDIIYCMNGIDWMWKLNWTTYTTFWTLAKITVSTISFTAATKIILDSAAWFVTAWFEVWMVFKVVWSTSNDWEYTIETVSASEIKVIATDTLVNETQWAEIQLFEKFAPAFSVDYNSSHFASWWTTNPNILYKSVGNDYEDFSSTWADSFEFQETITWLTTNNEALYIFTKNTVSAIINPTQDSGWTYYPSSVVQAKEWSINHNSIVSAWKNVYFVTPSNKIVQLARWANIDWFEVIELSERKYAWISKIMSTLDSDQTDSFGYYLPKENLIHWSFKTIWASFNDICIIYDITKNAFLVDSNKYLYWWINFKWNNYTISNIEPKVFQDEYWQDDEDSPIWFEYHTKYFDLWLPTRKKEIWEARTFVAINDLAELKQEIIVDGNTIDPKTIDKDNIPITTSWIGTKAIWTFAVWTEWLTVDEDLVNVDIIRTKWNLQIKWKKIKFIFTNNTLAWRVRLEDLEMMIELLPRATNNITI